MLTIQADDTRAVALGTAIRDGDVETLQRYLRDNPELATARVVDRRGVSRTLLHIAADWPGHFPNGPRTVAILVATGTDVNAQVVHSGSEGSPETGLHWAASSDDVGVLDALLDGGANIEAPGAVFTRGAPMSDAVKRRQARGGDEVTLGTGGPTASPSASSTCRRINDSSANRHTADVIGSALTVAGTTPEAIATPTTVPGATKSRCA
jgi:hypothetical protein